MKKQRIIGGGAAAALALTTVLTSATYAAGAFDDIKYTKVEATDNTTKLDLKYVDDDGKITDVTLNGSWGPQTDRTLYSPTNPAKEATFNSMQGVTNAAGNGLGDERQFVRIYEIDPEAQSYTAVQSLDLEAGKKYQVVIYYHNNAFDPTKLSDEDYNKLTEKEKNQTVAANTKVATWFPRTMKKDETGYVVGQITWTVVQTDATTQEVAKDQSPSESNPLHKVWASAKITAKEDIELQPINGHALLVNSWNHGLGNTSGTKAQFEAGDLFSPAYILSSNLFTANGTYIQSYNITDIKVDGKVESNSAGNPFLKDEDGNNKLDSNNNPIHEGPNGIILGCDEYAGRVTYQFQTVKPGLPSELPETGALQIVLAGALLVVVAGGVAFMMKTRTAARSARGRK